LPNDNKIHSSAGFYRPDIDGMRALAVCLVLAAHLHLPHLAGGFVGVDIFFVISGYLISSILVRQLNEGTFSILRFYDRRIRRIIPALFVVMLFTSVVAWHRIMPVDLVDFGRSLIAAMFSVSNIYFSQQSGYFDISSEQRPLLHTWSLGVEEQFYIVFPILLLLLFRYRRAWVSKVISLLALLSFVACAVLVYRFPTQTFYLAPTRAWELLVGVMLTMELIKLPPSKMLREIAGAAGFLLILAATLGFQSGNHFPGLRALLPCGGAALIILSGQQRDSRVYRLLALKPVVFVGAISYSVYLWHWPLIALRAYDFREQWHMSQAAVNVLVLAESFVTGILSWRFVETPFRTGHGLSRRSVFTASALAAILALAFGTYVVASHGATWRYKPQSVKVASYQQVGGDEVSYRVNHCFVLPKPGSSFLRDFDEQMCLPRSASKSTYLILGNSHAAHLWLGLSEVFTGIEWQQVTGVACLPKDDETHESASCREMRNFLFKQYLPSHHVDAILLSANWAPEDKQSLNLTLNELASFSPKVYVIGPIMRYDRPLPELLVDEIEQGKSSGLPLSAHLVPSVFATDKALKDVVSAHPGVRYISLIDLLCPQQKCMAYTPEGIPLQSDDSHLTGPGSIFLARTLQQAGFFSADGGLVVRR
jgi:peptidoglycan/LPS O-acetylase OafA/YrhL